MIKAHELRVGNWVKNKIDTYVKVLNIQEETINQIFDDDGVVGSYRIDYFEPIPLTPEILEKCGLSNVWIKESWIIVEDRFDLELFGYAMKVRNSSHTKEIEFAYFKYLHQLQNLYFALTGEELIINL